MPSKEAAAAVHGSCRSARIRYTALSDAQLSLRPDDHRERAVGTGGVGAGAGGPRRYIWEERRARLVARSRELHAQWRDEAERDGRGSKITSAWLNHCLREVVDRDTIVVSEYSFRQEHCPLETPGSLFGVSNAGGLGWGFGASLGAKLAAPDRMVLSVWATAPTCLPIPPRATTSRRCRSCRC